MSSVSGIKTRGESSRVNPRILLRLLLRSQNIENLKAKGSGESLAIRHDSHLFFKVGVLYSGEQRIGTVPPLSMLNSVWT